MRLFETRNSRNERIFTSEVGGVIADRVRAAGIGNTKSYSELLGISCGLARQFASQVQTIVRLWGKGDRERGLALCEVCIQPALSLWLDMGKDGDGCPAEALINTRITAISTALHILGTYSEDKERDLVSLDVQYCHDLEFKQRLSLYYADLLMSRLVEAAGGEGYIDWARQSTPVTRLSDMHFKDMPYAQGDVGYSVNERTLLISILSYYREIVKPPPPEKALVQEADD